MFRKILRALFVNGCQKKFKTIRRRNERLYSTTAIVESLEYRRMLSGTPVVLLADTFQPSTPSNDVNSQVVTRQTGLFAGTTFNESAATSSGGSYDYLTQASNGIAVLGTSGTQQSTYISPAVNLFAPSYGLNDIQVTITPGGPASTHWAGIALGGSSGAYISSAGVTGLIIYSGGGYGIWEGGAGVAAGTAASSSSGAYTIDFAINASTGAYTVSINGNAVYVGSHGGAYASTAAVTLENLTAAGTTDLRVDYFSNFRVTGVPAVSSTATTLLVDGFQPSTPSYDLNSQVGTRQTGLFAGTAYNEAAATTAAGSYDYLTQASNGIAVLGTNGTQQSTYISPALNLFTPSYGLNDIQVTITPGGPASSHWAGIALGGQAGAYVSSAGVTGLIIYSGGNYGIWEGGAGVAAGTATNSNNGAYTVDFAINSSTGAYTVSINGNVVYVGSHGGAYASTAAVTFENLTSPGITDLRVDYFSNFRVTGFPVKANVAAPNTTYYVSSTGNDANTGLSGSPWKTLARVNSEILRPGDSVLLEGGKTFNGTLQLSAFDSGTASSRVTISSYGTGNATINAGFGEAISGNNIQYVTISNLTLLGASNLSNPNSPTTASSEDNVTSGIDIRNYTYTANSGIIVTGINASEFGNSGVIFLGQFNDLAVSNSNLSNNGIGGLTIVNIEWLGSIANQVNSLDNFFFTSHARSQRVTVSSVTANNNAGSKTTAYSASGYGIFLNQVTDGIVVSASIYNNGWISGNQSGWGGLQADNSNHIVFEYNTVSYTRTGQSDGEGINFNNVTDSLIQYNTVSNNDAAGILVAHYLTGSSNNITIRYNVVSNNCLGSQGYAFGGMLIYGVVSNVNVYNNTVTQANSEADFRFQGWSGSNVQLLNNIFVNSGSNIYGGETYRYIASGTGTLFNNTSTVFTQASNYQGLVAPSGPRNSTINLTNYGIVWDQYNLTSIAFFGVYQLQVRRDYLGVAVPADNSGQIHVGAKQ